MSKKSGQTFSNTRLFSPSVIRRLHAESPVTGFISAADLSGSIQFSTASFAFDPPGTGIKSTQQIPLDWSRFENHTFFNSAESKVNVAFNTIINSFPFDGEKREFIEFFENLTGFEKYVYDSFPKNIGYLNFSGSAEVGPLKGTSIVVEDVQGTLYPTLSRNRKESGVLNPEGRPLSFEMFLYVPSGTVNNNEIIAQKLDNSISHGITLALSSSSEASSPEGECDVVMMVSSGSQYNLSASMTIQKGSFQHICGVWNRIPSFNIVELYNNYERKAFSPGTVEIGDLRIDDAQLLIGSGTSHSMNSFHSAENGFTPSSTLSGSIDEFRIWHARRKSKTQEKLSHETVYSQKHLALYYKFNEPTGSYSGNNIVLDSSGNSLHSTVTNYSTNMRIRSENSSLMTPGLSPPMKQEAPKFSPILFPEYDELVTLNSNLLSSGSAYDANNPNLITKLIPTHYFYEATYFEGFENEEANTGDSYSSSVDFPGAGKIGSPQIISAIAFTWAKFFDEIKLYLDQLGNVLSVDYIDENTIADQFLPFLANYYGFDLPNMFSDASIRQYSDGYDLTLNKSISSHPLQYVQNQIWKRVLTDVLEIVRSKGTIRSIRAAFANMGINPDKGFRFREYGGNRFRVLSDVRENRQKITRVLTFSGSLGKISNPSDVNAQGKHQSMPFFQSAFLSGSRLEPGIPYPAGNNGTLLVNPVTGTDNPSDGLFTSGSWSYEALYRFPISKKEVRPLSQSLARIMTTGSDHAAIDEPRNIVLGNLLAIQGREILNTTSSIQFFMNPSITGSISAGGDLKTDKALHLMLTGANIFDGNPWHISVGRVRSDLTGSINSSSYFLRAGRQNNGKIVEYFYAEKIFNDHHDENYFEKLDPHHNASGSFIAIGSQSLGYDYTWTTGDQPDFCLSTSSVGLNNGPYLGSEDSTSPDYKRIELCTNFDGEVSHVRFWSKRLTIGEDREHTKNFRSLGVENPIKNFNFQKHVSGSFEKLRMDISIEQPITGSTASGEIEFIDYSQNGLIATAEGFEPLSEVCKPLRVTYSQLTTKVDEPTTNDKIRIRSYKDKEKAKFNKTRVAPIHELDPREQVQDDARFSVEISSVQALNDDIINIFSTLNALDDIIGSPNLVFSPDYPDLENMRQIYFNRLTDKLNIKTFFEFFKWFDTSVGTLIERLVPRKTNFLGVNFVIEPHMLERAKFHYNYADIYLGENDRMRGIDTMLLQQFLANIRKY